MVTNKRSILVENEDMTPLEAYQSTFTKYIRYPSNNHSKYIDQRGMAIYREIVFNNFLNTVTACFPVLLNIIGKRHFKKLVRQCFHLHHFKSPLFRDIPLAFLEYLQSLDFVALDLPPFTAQLAHYEWAEVYLSHMVVNPEFTSPLKESASLLNEKLELNPAHLLLQYDYPVHILSKKHSCVEPHQTYLCLVRQYNFRITFIEINQLTQALLQCLKEHPQTGNAVLNTIASHTTHLYLELVLQFGSDILQRLYEQEIVRISAGNP